MCAALKNQAHPNEIHVQSHGLKALLTLDAISNGITTLPHDVQLPISGLKMHFNRI